MSVDTAEIQLLDGNFYTRDPHRSFRWMRANAPVYWDAGGSVWGIALHEDIMAVSKDPETFCSRFSSRPDAPPIPSMINIDDPDHKRRRNLVNKGFTPRRVQEHEPRIRDICNQLIDRVAPRGACDFVHDIAAPLPMIVIGDMLGVEPADRDMLLHWSDDLLAATSMTAPPEVLQRAQQAFEEYADYNRRVVADRRRHPRDDLMSVLTHAEIDGQRLTDDEILQEGLLILVGGDETTRHVISGGMEQLIRHPAQRRKLIDDPSKIPVAAEEMLRWVTPIQNMNRTATRTVALRGQTIREGDKVLLLYPSANRDERVFDRPFDFNVEREPNNHVAFGGYGTHFCLGASLARLELRVMFEEVLRRLPDIELACNAPLPLRPSNFVVGIESMPVVFTSAHC
ncbi:MAG TPA: cytochrome P450 [Candidatus Margulisiibacteriota bacterium]|nr:cytochrome P450 [Candidatus Margulisiibacteriota bacterium]